MNRKLLYLTTIILTLAGCASEDYVGNEELHEANEKGRPVSFDLTSAPQTRSERYGAEAASDLNNNFVVWGDKTMSDDSKQTVFNNYQVNYVANSAYTSTTNSAGWEYLGYVNVPNGITTDVGVSDFSENTTDNPNGVWQSIKYWDFSATRYDFCAYSLGKGDKPGDPNTKYATASQLYDDTDGHKYTLTGTIDQLAACFISDKMTRLKAEMSATNTQVSLKFRRLGAKVRIALYETIPGYSVKDVKFYRVGSVESGATAAEGYGTTAYLYAANYAETTPTILSHTDGTGTISVRYDNETPTLTWAPTNEEKDKPYISFGDSDPTATDWANWAEKDYKQAVGKYIGRSSVAATGPKDFMSVLPTSSDATPTDLKLKVDYTLLSRDDSEEEIHVTGATATVPAQFAVWKPNCAYTYIFKISDNTDGSTGQGILGLSPITLDAVYVNAEGQQETITTVSEPSITTYQKDADHTISEYKAGDIYVVVHDGTNVVELTSSNSKLYTAEATLSEGAVANITEASVANAIKSPEGAKDANNNPLAVAAVAADAEDKLHFITTIPAEATPDGSTVTINGAKFKALGGATEKYYVFEYLKAAAVADPPKPAEYQYKVIKVAAAP